MVVHLDPQFAAPLDEEHVCGLDCCVVGVEVRRVLKVGGFGFAVAIGQVFDVGWLERVGVVVGRGDQQVALAQPGNERGAGLVARPLATVSLAGPSTLPTVPRVVRRDVRNVHEQRFHHVREVVECGQMAQVVLQVHRKVPQAPQVLCVTAVGLGEFAQRAVPVGSQPYDRAEPQQWVIAKAYDLLRCLRHRCFGSSRARYPARPIAVPPAPARPSAGSRRAVPVRRRR